jgi:uncharacterized protein (TIGR00297 family)
MAVRWSSGGIAGDMADAVASHSPPELLLSVLLCVLLGVFAHRRNILDARGSLMAVVVGLLISFFTDLAWLMVLLLFLITTFAVTRYNFQLKKKQGLAEGRAGERGVRNVLANGLVPTVVAVFATSVFGMGIAGILFITSLSVAASDSFASEIGVLSNRTYLITHPGRRVRAGRQGGVSWKGQGAALVGAAIPSVLGWVLLSDLALRIPLIGGWLSPEFHMMPFTPLTLLIPLVVGFFGCQVDSILGATLQSRGKITNDEVNYISIYVGVVLAWLAGSILL